MDVKQLMNQYERLIEKRQAQWIALGRDPEKLDPTDLNLLNMDIRDFIRDAHNLPEPFRVMVAQCLEAFLVKYNLEVPLGLRLETAAAPLSNLFPDELTEWQITLRQQVLER